MDRLQAALDAKVAEAAAVQAALGEVAGSAQRAQQALQDRCDALESGLREGAAAKAAAEERCAGLEAALAELQGGAAAKEGELSAQLAALSADLEAARGAKEGVARDLASVSMRLEIVTQEATAKVRGRGGGCCWVALGAALRAAG